MPQAVSYTRFSALHQGKGSSTARQKQLIATWLSENPTYELSALSADDHGRSGYKGEQLKHGLGSILDAINAKKLRQGDVLLIEALDRLGRLPPLEMLSLITRILNAGVSIITLEDNKTYSSEGSDNNTDLWMLLGKVQQAHEYSARLGARVKASYVIKREKAKQGIPIRIYTPTWLNSDGSIKKEEAEAVLYCIDRYLKGHGTRRIILEGMKLHPTLSKIHPTTLRRWFENRALIGQWRDTKPFTPLINTETFYKLQQQIEKRKKKMSPEQTYSLSGIVVCESCNSRYYYRRKVQNPEAIVYGNCSTYLKRGATFCNNKKSIPYETLDFAFKKTYEKHIWLAASNHSANKVDSLVADLVIKLQSIENEIELYLDLLKTLPGQEQTISRIAKLDAEKQELQLKKFELESGKKLSSSIKEAIDFIQGTNIDMQNNMETWNKRLELMSDEIMLREAVKDVDYRLRAVGNTIESPDKTIFTIIKRSQIHGRYIVHCLYNDKSSTWAAVSRLYRPIEASTEELLYLELEKYSHPNDFPDDMGNFPSDQLKY